MTADYAALEARVAELEQQLRHMVPAKIDAVSYGVGVMHADMRERFDTLDEHMNRLELHLTDQDDRLDSHGRMLTEILRRLPTEPGQ